MTSPAKMCGSGQCNCDPQNIAAPRKDCGSFVDETLRAIHRRNLIVSKVWENRYIKYLKSPPYGFRKAQFELIKVILIFLCMYVCNALLSH